MILLLAGTAEARALAEALSGAGIAACASFAGAVAEIDRIALPHRVGGFGGEAGFRRYLSEEGITAVIDATHPFAAQITPRTARVCGDLGLPYLRLQRPAWQAGEGDRWTFVARPEDLPRVIPQGARVFLSVGRKELARYQGLEGREVVLRSIDPPGDLPDGWRCVQGRPPFPVEEEKALFALTGIEWVVTKNAGGASSMAKLVAARQLGLAVAMIERPPLPEGVDVAEDVETALHWAREHAS